jgi:radical SAM protein with 4Fe4S-binding SPASM domain
VTGAPSIRGLDFREDVIRDALGLGRMLMLTTFSEPSCNLKCPYCFTASWTREQREEPISESEFNALLAQARGLGVGSLWWVGQGEPLLHPAWRERLLSAQMQGIWCGVFTNGTSLDRPAAEFVLDHDVSLYMKLNSFSAVTQGLLIGGDGAAFLGKVLPRIEWFVQQGMAKSRRLAVESVITKLNYDELPRLFRWCRDREIIPFFEMMEHACEGARSCDVSESQHVELFQELQRIDREEYGYVWDALPPWASHNCRNLYLGLAVDAWGEVTPCSGMRYRLGNIREQGLKEIWESEEARKMRNPSRHEPRPWDGLSLGRYGCKSHALHVTGDPCAVDPRCEWFASSAGGSGTTRVRRQTNAG